MDSFVYRWKNLTLNKIYVGFHKGTEDDGYVCSSSSDQFWEDYNNLNYKWEREILFKGTMKECQLLESQILDKLDVTSDNVYNNKNNLMFNLNDEVRFKLSVAAQKRGSDSEYRRQQSERTKKQWEDPNHRRRISEANIGKTHSEHTKDKIRVARSKQIITPESREKTAEKLRGRERPQYVKDAIAIARTSAPLVTCPHCGKVGKYGGSMSRWHFDNCKKKNNND